MHTCVPTANMNPLLNILTFVGILNLAFAEDLGFEPLSDAEIQHINTVQSSWRAGRNFHPHQLPYVKTLLGQGLDWKANLLYNKHLNEYTPRRKINPESLPTNFDARDQWSTCPTLKAIPDQGECASGWAMAPANALSDRICVATGQSIDLSAEDVVTCVTQEFGCIGGTPNFSWDYFKNTGVVTGGDYGTKSSCRPYTFEPCEHYRSGKLRNCTDLPSPTPACETKCIDGYNKTYTQDKHFGNSTYFLDTVDKIMTDLYLNGPVTATFTVHMDFVSYKSGVYKQTSDVFMGWHTVRILGWGVENGTDYWLAANSWRSDWGDKGTFKIAKGINECSIEKSVVAGLPKI